MSNIEKSKSDLAKKNHPHLEWSVGDILLDIGHSGSDLLKITKLTKKKISYLRWCHYTNGTQDWADSPSTYEWDKFEYFHSNCIKLEKDWEECEKEALLEIQDMEQLEKKLGLKDVSDETQLARTGNKDMLTAAKTELERRKNKVEIIRAVLQDKMNELSNIVDNFKNQIQKITKVIGVVELYLGVREEIIQIQLGESANPKEPISIRQQLLFMDEEIGDPEDGGLDAYSIEGFDSWISEPENLQRVLPEKKGIVSLRVRRDSKNYNSNNPWVEAILNQENFKTYFLIRNGDNLYRIWADIAVYPRLFPTKEELDPDEDDGFAQKRFEESEFEYKKYGLFLQGILHRTHIFQPLAEEIHVFQPETWNGMLNFIRDDEMLLPTGRLSWREWRDEINKKIQTGSRIIYKKESGYSEKDFMKCRTNYMYGGWTPTPETSLYVVTDIGRAGTYHGYDFKFLYLPGDKIWRGWDKEEGERKKRIGFWCYSDEVLNYDQLDLEDIEFYINCRTERRNYLDMMPILYQLRRDRLEELEREKLFVQLVVQRNSIAEEDVWKAVDWWKFKNKWKRPIDQDDAKALRMIERKLKGKVK